jgi:hypothetical protein
VDGYRFDRSKGVTQKGTIGSVSAWGQYDQDRVDILTGYADAAWSVNPNAYVILEHFADNSEETVLSDYGCMLWGNLSHPYNEGTMGYNESGKSDFSWISYQERGWDDPHVMGYMESHDEERLMAKNLAFGASSGDYNTQDLNIALKRMQLAAAFLFTIPGPKMLWQFGELGYDLNINYPGEIGGSEYRTDPKPILWNYADEWNRKVLYNVYSELIHLKTSEPVFKTTDFSLDLNDELKTIHLNHTSMNVTVLGNFDLESGDINPNFQHTGWWYDYFSGDSLEVNDVTETITLEAGEYRIYTDKKFDRPEIGLSVNENEIGNFVDLNIFPNPTDGAVTVGFELLDKSFVRLSVLGTDGRIIRDYGTVSLPSGTHSFIWDGKTQAGEKALAGIYFLRLSDGTQQTVKKLIIR